ncbi:hypothetical protein F5884DRAFT_396549 [Xylogone sp. PMI_703]|nr:hypothetical protein F5884DRAFT_396549 [Xylogone sp. PMI_703]
MPVYVVTGANRGLGLEFVTQLSQDSSNTIIATTRSLSSDLSELEALKSKNSNLHIVECNTGSVPSIKTFAKQVDSIIGEDTKLDFLLNNAGVNSVSHETAMTLTADGLDEQIKVNVLGPATIVQELLNHLKSGSVVMNMTSGLGSIGLAAAGDTVKCTTYSISKAAVNMLSVHQAVELKPKGVIVICMDPGWVKTRMGGEGAILEKDFSIKSMLKVLGSVTINDSPKFYTYSGEEKPW